MGRGQVGAATQVAGVLRKIAPAAIIVFFACAYTLVYWRYIIDDAYITFAYAKNFAEHGELVIRLGNNVSANSSFSWSLLLGALSSVAGDPVIWAKLLGPILFCAALGMMMLAVGRGRRTWEPAVIALAGAASSHFGLWANYGMENGLYAVSVWLLAFGVAGGRGRWAIPLTVIGALLVHTTRPEGFMVVGALLALGVARRLLAPQPGDRRWYASLAIVALAIGAYSAFQIAYYGSILPNSASAKVVGSTLTRAREGFGYLTGSPTRLGGWVVIAAIAWAGLDVVSSRGRALVSFIVDRPLIGAGLLIAGLQCALVLATGWDWMPNGRFLAVSAPFCAMYVAARLIDLRWGPAALRYAALGAFMALWLATQVKSDITSLRTVDGWRDSDERTLVQMVKDLNPISTPRDVLGLADIGRAAYFYRGDVFDWWGLASRLVASRGESLGRIRPQTVYEVSPSFLILYSNKPALVRSATLGAYDHALPFLRGEELNRRYCFVRSYEYTPYKFYVLLVRRDLQPRLNGQPAFPARSRAACQPAVVD